MSKCTQKILSVTNLEKINSSPTGDPNMSQLGKVEHGLRPARLSRINYVVDILKEKGNTYIKETKILILFKILAFICLVYFRLYGTFSILCNRVDRLQKVAIFVRVCMLLWSRLNSSRAVV
jgi:hypothetical protein